MKAGEAAGQAVLLGFGDSFDVLPLEPERTLVRVVAPHFVAGLEMEDDLCVTAAPILYWAKGKRRDWLRAEFVKRGYKASLVKELSLADRQIKETRHG